MNNLSKHLGEQKLISCILPKGIATDVVEALRTDKGILTGNIDNARGAGHLTPTAHRHAGDETEKEILTVIVDTAQAESLFDWLFEQAQINRPHGGIMYMTGLQDCTPYSLPDRAWEQ